MLDKRSPQPAGLDRAPAPRLRRISRRVVLPTAGITVAVAGLALLTAMSTEPAPRHASGLAPGAPSGPSAQSATVVPAVPVLEPGGSASSAAVAARPGARPGSVHFEPPRARLRAPAPLPGSAPLASAPTAAAPTASTPTAAPAATGGDAYVAQALATPELLARLRIVDERLRDGEFHEAEAVALALLDAPASDPTEEEPARIALLSRLGFVPHSVAADRRLLAALAADRPRAERLTAVDALGRGQGLHPLYAQALEPVAETDADPDVRKRARTALGRD